MSGVRWCNMTAVAEAAEAGGGCGAAVTERKTRTPHSDVGNYRMFGGGLPIPACVQSFKVLQVG